MTFFSGIGNYFALVVQSYRWALCIDDEYNCSATKLLESAYIPALCETLMSLHSSDEEALQKFLQLLYLDGKRLGEYNNCLDFSYKSMLQLFSEFSDRSSGSKSDCFSIFRALSSIHLQTNQNLLAARAWFYQTCNQFGWYTTTSHINTTSTSSTFGREVPLWYFEQLCRDAFGSGQTPATLALGIAQMNAQFGGLSFNQSMRYREVVFTHGELDPWRALGQQHDGQALVIAGKQLAISQVNSALINLLLAAGYSHVEDLTSINVRDSVPMNLAKLRVMSFLRRHIAPI